MRIKSDSLFLEKRIIKLLRLFFFWYNKKTPAEFCRVLQYPFGLKAKGEEKPEEELMGKRKSSPRLATTSSNDVVIFIISNFRGDIHLFYDYFITRIL